MTGPLTDASDELQAASDAKLDGEIATIRAAIDKVGVEQAGDRLVGHLLTRGRDVLLTYSAIALMRLARQPVAHTAPRALDCRWLQVGDQVLVAPPIVPDAVAKWVIVWSPLVGLPPAPDARWMTVAAILRSDVSDVMAVELEDGARLELTAGLDQVQVRIPCGPPTVDGAS